MRTWADGRTLLLGSPSLLRAENVTVSQEAADWVDKLRRQAETPLLLAVDGTLVGLDQPARRDPHRSARGAEASCAPTESAAS